MNIPLPVLILNGCCQVAKYEMTSEIQCPECGERLSIWSHGSYLRYKLESNTQVSVPRYRCLALDCPRKTFSILPFPFLRYVRHSLCTLMIMVLIFLKGSQTKSELGRDLNVGRRRLGRALVRGLEVWRWFRKESVMARWGPWPPHKPELCWTAFTQSFSHRFYPYIPLHLQPT